MKYLPFDSRDAAYKSVFGALLVGQPTDLRLLLHRDAVPEEVMLLIKRDGEEYLPCRMTPAEWLDDNYRWYEYTLAVENAGLYFYHFCYTAPYGAMTVTRDRFGEGTVSADGTDWQLTVYEHTAMPKGYEGGLIYQIFPDRFYNSGKPKTEVPEDRFLRSDWGGTPAFVQEDTPCRLGNDYFGGDLAGIEEKLPYLQSLGVTVLYLNPIFEAHSNHRYNTADYEKIDPLLGTEADFTHLCKAAEKRGIRILLDGVFSHTGDDSRYFNRYHRYPNDGAAEREDSPYRTWYHFDEWPNRYHSWWGVPSLPETREEEPSFCEYITGKNGILAKWMKAGASGFRLDVADELPDMFLDAVSRRVHKENKNALLIGEVWEDATNKISYGHRRRYLLGHQLDSVMNYPFGSAILDFCMGGNGFSFMDTLLSLLENYPRPTWNLLMNHIGTHDTARVLTVLGKDGVLPPDRPSAAVLTLSEAERSHAVALLKLASVLQYTLPGIPSLYYGDEAGLEGGADPFSRGCYPWGKEDPDLLAHYRLLGALRKDYDAFSGDFRNLFAGLGLVCYERIGKTSDLLIAVNRWHEPDCLPLSPEWQEAESVIGIPPENGILTLPAYGFAVLKK